MHHWAKLLSLSLLIYLSSAGPDDPTFPKLREMATTFESSIEITDQMQEITSLVKEYYDADERIGRTDILEAGIKLRHFYDDKTDQIFTVNDTACVEDDGGIFELGITYYGWTSKKPLFVGPSALILLKENDPPEYVQNEYVRGILCEWYHLETSEKGQNATLDYYFSVPEWDMPFHEGENKKRFPVRIAVYVYGDKNDQAEIIDYLYFRPKLNDRSMFQPPVGMGCWLKRPTVPHPFIPKQYTFSMEEFDLKHDAEHSDTDVTTATVWYDYREKYARRDRYTSQGKISDLYDFKTGVRYHMHDDRTCIFRAMRDLVFLKFPPDSLVGEMKDPYEVLNLQNLQDDEDDTTYYTMGQDEVRGVTCNVFEKVERDAFFFDVRYKMLVTTVYVTTESTKLQVDGEDLDFSPPLKIILTGYEQLNNVSLKKQYQIFSFDDEPGRQFFTTYYSDECFPRSNQKSYFVIVLDAPIEIAKAVEANDTAFSDLARNVIINVANITEFRLPFLRADFRSSGIYLTGLMLDQPAALDQFWKEFDEPVFTTKISAYEIVLEAASEESCAAACIDYTEPCKGFHFCGKGCFINLGEITDTPVDNIDLNLDCYVYIRAVSDSRNDKASLEQALKTLKTATKMGTLKFTATIGENSALLPAIAVVTEFNNRGGDDVSSYPYTLVKAGFQFKSPAQRDTTVEAPDALSENDCYRQCKDSTSISCSSFSYCAKASNKMCRITPVLLDGSTKDNSEIDANAACDIFSLLYLDMFDQYPGQVVAIPGDKVAEEAYSTETCAKACKEETGFKCRGFEYCDSQKSSCVLHSKHVMDLKPGESLPAKSECVHYAVKFIADYRDMKMRRIEDESNRRTDMTLEECARACSEELPGCNSFNYCPATMPGMTDSSCSLTSLTPYGTDTVPSDKCRLYTKRENVEDWRPRAPQKEGYTSGGFAGLLIGMIILGLVIGALLFVGYSFFRSRRGGGDGLTVKFSKHDNM